MKVRFQADADLNQDIVQAIRRREPTVDFQTAHEAGLAGLHDTIILERAAQEGRIVVSHDRRTMPHHFATFIASQTSTGVIIVPKSLSIRQVLNDLLLIWEASEAEERVNQIDSLPF
jgi:predicted nuclease of predicted toxin-antitoxin system